jgi:hypothetical protein
MGQYLLFLPAAVQRAVHHACSALGLLRVSPTVSTVVHLGVDSASRTAFLAPSRALSTRQFASSTFAYVCVLAQRSLNVLRVRVHIVEYLVTRGTSPRGSELADIVRPLNELIID